KGAPGGKPFGEADHPMTEATDTTSDTTAPPKAAPSTAPTPAPANPSPKATGTVTTTTAPVVTKPIGFGFPFKAAYGLAEAVRKGLAQGTTTVTFGHRKLENWATLSARLIRSGFVRTPEEAIALAYHMTVVAREIEGNRKFVCELFSAKFGNKFPTDSPTQSFIDIVDFAVSENLPLYLTGEPGVGKTYTLLDSIRRAGREPIRVQGSGELVKADVEGSTGYAEGTGTVWTDGSLAIAARDGRPFVFDEFDKARDDVQSVFTALLESHDGTMTVSATGERIVPRTGFGIFATGNTVGLGEGVQFEGTRVINEAIRDRFYFLTVEYMTEATAKRLVADQLAAFGAKLS